MEAIPLICAWWWCPVPGASGILSIGTDSDAFTQTLTRVRTKRVFNSPELGFSKNNTLIPQDSCGCNKGFCAKAKPRVGIPNSLSDPQQAQLYVLVHTNRGGDKNKRSQKPLLCLHLLRLPASFSGSLRECFTRVVPKKASDEEEKTRLASSENERVDSQASMIPFQWWHISSAFFSKLFFLS